MDSTFCQTHGNRKQGAGETAYTGEKGYHPLIASRSGSGEIPHARLRRGVAHTGKGSADFIAETISRAGSAGAHGPVTVRADSGFHGCDFARACQRRGAKFSITARDMRGALSRTVRRGIGEEDRTPIPGYAGAAASEIPYVVVSEKGKRLRVRLIVRRVPLDLGPLLKDQTRYRRHFFIADREGDLLDLEKDHRRHAECECVICDLKYGMGLDHLPSGNFGANAAWLRIQAAAHNVFRWLQPIANPGREMMTSHDHAPQDRRPARPGNPLGPAVLPAPSLSLALGGAVDAGLLRNQGRARPRLTKAARAAASAKSRTRDTGPWERRDLSAQHRPDRLAGGSGLRPNRLLRTAGWRLRTGPCQNRFKRAGSTQKWWIWENGQSE